MELQMMVINTDQTAPTVRPVEYHGPSSGEMVGAALMQGLGMPGGVFVTRVEPRPAGDVGADELDRHAAVQPEAQL